MAAEHYFPFGGAFPLPPPEGLPVVLGRLGTAGVLEPPPALPLPLLDEPELLLLPDDFDITLSCLRLADRTRDSSPAGSIHSEN